MYVGVKLECKRCRYRACARARPVLPLRGREDPTAPTWDVSMRSFYSKRCSPSVTKRRWWRQSPGRSRPRTGSRSRLEEGMPLTELGAGAHARRRLRSGSRRLTRCMSFSRGAGLAVRWQERLEPVAPRRGRVADRCIRGGCAGDRFADRAPSVPTSSWLRTASGLSGSRQDAFGKIAVVAERPPEG